MIRLTCANCQTQIEVDDAFAGGVCRCKHCGAIQTVPRRVKSGSGQTVSGKVLAGDEPKTLYTAKARTGLSSTPSGLEELAEAVHGSGLSSSGLGNRVGGSRGPGLPVAPSLKPPKSKLPLFIGLGIAIVLFILAGVIWLMPAESLPGLGTTPPAGTHSATAEPKFAGVTLSGDKVVFLLDRGDATSAFMPALKSLTVNAVRSLGPDRRFQVVLWDNGATDAYPALAAGYASPAEAEKLARWFDGVNTGRSTDVLPALKMALDTSPTTLVLATGKSLQLGPDFAKAVDTALAARPAKPIVHAFTLGETAPDDPLRTIAESNGGRFTALNGDSLATLAN
ncbi:MAG: hypothetical protein QM754_20175 [Tepidisphaeraceae bacterium]